MASIISQAVFHPVVSQSLKYGGTTLGRDKVWTQLSKYVDDVLTCIRLIVRFSTSPAFMLGTFWGKATETKLLDGWLSSLILVLPESVRIPAIVSFELSLTRRPVMRLGKPIECLQAALKASFSPGPVAEIITMVARQVGYFSYLNYDALIWICNPQLIGTYTTLNSYQM